MTNNPGPARIGSGVKKTVLLIVVLAAVLPALFYLLSRPKDATRPQEPKVIVVGDRAPDFMLPALDGRQVRLSDLHGKVVLVHFWATWCPPCVEEIPTLDRIARSLPQKDFAVLAVSVDEGGAPAVGSFVQRNRLTLPVLLDSDHDVSAAYGTFKFPETYVLGRDGLVKYKIIGPADWNDPATLRALQELAAVH